MGADKRSGSTVDPHSGSAVAVEVPVDGAGLYSGFRLPARVPAFGSCSGYRLVLGIELSSSSRSARRRWRRWRRGVEER